MISRNTIVSLLLIVALIFFAYQSTLAATENAATENTDLETAAQNGQQATTQIQLTQEEIDSISGAMHQGEARTMFEERVATAEAEAKDEVDSMPRGGGWRAGEGAEVYYDVAAGAIDNAKKKLLAYFTEPASQTGEWKAAFNNINRGKGLDHLIITVLIAIAIVGVGLFVERLVKRAIQPLRQQILERARLGRLRFLGRVISNFLLNLLGFATFVATTFLLHAVLIDHGSPRFDVIGFFLLPAYYIKFLILVANLGLSPAAPALRLFPVQDEDATFLYRWTIRLTVTGIVVASIAYVFRNAGIGEDQFLFLYGFSGLAVNFLLVIMIWRSRKRVARAIWPGVAIGEQPQGSFREKFSRAGIISH